MNREWLKCPLRLVSIVLLSIGCVASADEPLPPTEGGLELSLGFGYGRGLGPVGAGVPTMQGFSRGGGTAVLDLGWRVNGRWMAGTYGEFGLFEANESDTTSSRSAALGIQGQFHVMPERRYDPWIGLGFGWRGYWADRHSGKYKLQGLDLVRVRVGVDSRVSQTLAIGPVVGMTVTQFLSASPGGSRGYSDVTDRKINTFFFGGLAGRFSL